LKEEKQMEAQQGQRFIETSQLKWEEVGAGIRRSIAAYDDQLMVTCVEFQKGAVGVLHRHPHRQITYVQAGSFEVTISNEKKVLRSGDFYHIPPDAEHGVTALEAGLLVDTFAPARLDFLK
jgi:quercetin dioxygenase-like cupin family protein